MQPTPPPPLILFQQDALVVVNKPAGLLVHRSEIDRHETDFLLQRVRDVLGEPVYAINRLDKPTSGIVLMTTDRTQVAGLSEALKRPESRKTYLAVVRGVIPESGLIDKPLKRIQDDHDPRPIKDPDLLQDSRTEFTRLAQCELQIPIDRYATTRYSLVKLGLLTGRRHQLRRHMKSLSHPIIGDTSYGKSLHNRLFAEQFQSHRLLLHAWKQEFTHPENGQMLSFTAPLCEQFNRVLDALNWTAVLENSARS